jgi:hypothetical protein
MLRSYDILVVIFQEEQEEEKLATTPNEASHKKRTTPSGKLSLNPTLPNFVVAKRVGKDRKQIELCPREKRARTDAQRCWAGPHGPAGLPPGFGPPWPIFCGPLCFMHTSLCDEKVQLEIAKSTQ